MEDAQCLPYFRVQSIGLQTMISSTLQIGILQDPLIEIRLKSLSYNKCCCHIHYYFQHARANDS